MVPRPLHDQPTTPLFIKSEIVLCEGKTVLDNFTLPPQPTDDFPIHYAYKDDAPDHQNDGNAKGSDTYTTTLNQSGIASLIQSGGGSSIIQVVEFKNCSRLKDIFEEYDFGNRWKLDVPTTKHRPMHSDVSVKARGESSLVFIRIPYLGLKGHPGADGLSFQLFDYMNSSGAGRGTTGDIWVHQAWFIVVKSHTILTARSSGDINSSGRPILNPCQHRQGVFHALMHMISQLIESSEGGLLEELSDATSLCEFQSVLPEDSPDTRKEQLWKHQAKMIGVRHVLDDQLKILTRFQHILRHSRDKDNAKVYNRNTIRIPIISQLGNDVMSHTMTQIDTVLHERREVHEKLSQMIKNVRFLTKAAQNATLESTIEDSVNHASIVAKETAKEQVRQAEALTEEIAFQGRAVSAFTALNVLFLPLGFFAQFLGLEASGNFGKYQGYFWSITAPVTGAIMAVTLYYVIGSQYEWRKFWRWLGCMVWEWRVIPLMDRATIHAQKRFLNGLPLYKIKLEPISSVSDPNASAPNASAPNASASNSSSPDAAAPNASEMDASAPNASAPNASELDASAPNASASNASGPNASNSNTSDPDASALNATAPNASASNASGPNVSVSNTAPNIPINRAASNVTVQSNAQYILQPDVRKRIDNQAVTFGFIDHTKRMPGVFRFDKTTGYLFLNSIDKHDYMYHAHIKPSFPAEGRLDRSIVWKKIQKPFEKEPWFFKGKFKKVGNELRGILSRKPRRTLWYKEFEYEGHRSPPTGPKAFFMRTVKLSTLGFGMAAVGLPPSQSPIKKVDESKGFFGEQVLDRDHWELHIRGLHEPGDPVTDYKLILEPVGLEEDYDGL
ncbi:hypothetical protein BZA77DRAFT_391827 [Pyronema omphalodes]|nr:hypothetical protein BZA77DRAFT_391827 [Pyronema omphalodes]